MVWCLNVRYKWVIEIVGDGLGHWGWVLEALVLIVFGVEELQQ